MRYPIRYRVNGTRSIIKQQLHYRELCKKLSLDRNYQQGMRWYMKMHRSTRSCMISGASQWPFAAQDMLSELQK